MAAVLPSSLAPHVCVVCSPDLVGLLNDEGLPPMHYLLQSFSPLQNVKTRTTTLSTVSLASFALRISDLAQVESACKEDEESRAGRTLDWIGGRVARNADAWLGNDPNGARPKGTGTRTAWWDELRRCAEADLTPSRSEGWNHPAAIILAVSTSAPNPLAAISALHSRPIDLPQWVDPNVLRFTLVVHSPRSTLNEDECAALMNAAKKQYGLHVHYLSLLLGEPSGPMPSFTIPPRLPAAADASLPEVPDTHQVRLSSADFQQFGKFVREFVAMSLIPWMERCVLEWNENFAANRRVATRLFSTTRRFFGSSNGSVSYSSNPASPVSTVGPQPPPASAPPQQRRLAEFATILGDYKLAIPVWEAWRKEGRGGSEVLPLLLAPSPAVGAHVAYALQSIHADQQPTAQVQYRALLFAVRWEIGIQDFQPQGGDRWLSWAAGSAEEPYASILLAHAALLAARAGALRRAGMWYADAAARMEKSGIKPMAIHFLRQADDIFRIQPPRELSPLCDEAVGKSAHGFPSLPLRIQHNLARLLYATGKTEESARLFAEMFRPYADTRAFHLHDEASGHAQTIIDDFRVAVEHVHSLGDTQGLLSELKPTISFVVPSASRLRFDRQATPGKVTPATWAQLDDIWSDYAKRHALGKRGNSKHVDLDEPFWVDVVLENPLPVEVSLVNVSVSVEQSTHEAKPPVVEVVDEIVLGPKEFRTISIAITAHHASVLNISHLNYSFLSLLPMSEPLARRGRRLHATPVQRQTPTYGPPVPLTVEVGGDMPRLDLSWSPDDDNYPRSLFCGELHFTALRLSNIGTKPLSEIWLTASADSGIVSFGDVGIVADQPHWTSNNSIALAEPFSVPLNLIHSSSVLQPGESCLLPVTLSPIEAGTSDVCVTATFREDQQAIFCASRVHRAIHVYEIFEATLTAAPRQSADGSFLVTLDLENTFTSSAEITQVSTISPSWSCSALSLGSCSAGTLHPLQSTRIVLSATPWQNRRGGAETEQHVTSMFHHLIQGKSAAAQAPPTIDLTVSHAFAHEMLDKRSSLLMSATSEAARRRLCRRTLRSQFDHVPEHTLPSIFPLYHPRAVDVVIHWAIPAEQRVGMLVLTNRLSLGAAHGSLNKIIEEARSGKAKRTIFAETQRAQAAVLESLASSVWNEEMNPVVLHAEATPVEHDFGQGACNVDVRFKVHNYSLTRPARFVLRLSNSTSVHDAYKAATFIGSQNLRGEVEALQHKVLVARVRVPGPGRYAIGGWALETEVGDSSDSWTRTEKYISVADRTLIIDVSAS